MSEISYYVRDVLLAPMIAAALAANGPVGGPCTAVPLAPPPPQRSSTKGGKNANASKLVPFSPSTNLLGKTVLGQILIVVGLQTVFIAYFTLYELGTSWRATVFGSTSVSVYDKPASLAR